MKIPILQIGISKIVYTHILHPKALKLFNFEQLHIPFRQPFPNLLASNGSGFPHPNLIGAFAATARGWQSYAFRTLKLRIGNRCSHCTLR